MGEIESSLYIVDSKQSEKGEGTSIQIWHQEILKILEERNFQVGEMQTQTRTDVSNRKRRKLS